MSHNIQANSLSHSSTVSFNGRGVNVILLGATGAGKSTTGWLLARLLGYGFLDLDHLIEKRAGKPIADIFASTGETEFRTLETSALTGLHGINSHVLAVGAGACVEDENWESIRNLGISVWLNTPSEEIARRLLHNQTELAKRPLLLDVLNEQDPTLRQKLLSERLKALIGHRVSRYKQADVTVADAFSTADTTARLIKDSLHKTHPQSFPLTLQTLDRWHIM